MVYFWKYICIFITFYGIFPENLIKMKKKMNMNSLICFKM